MAHMAAQIRFAGRAGGAFRSASRCAGSCSGWSRIITARDQIVSESALTGESMPVEKNVGVKAVSATILTGGYLELTADRVGSDTTLSQIVQLMEQDHEGRRGRYGRMGGGQD